MKAQTIAWIQCAIIIYMAICAHGQSSIISRQEEALALDLVEINRATKLVSDANEMCKKAYPGVAKNDN